MRHKSTYLIGVSGRSGSGKSTFVHEIQKEFGQDVVAIHTMDNYYKDRQKQIIDDAGFKNFDLPTSFETDKFYNDLILLKSFESVKLPQYHFNCKYDNQYICINPAPILIIEGLFVYFYDRVRKLLDYKVMLDLSYAESYSRRLYRDQVERNYKESEIAHRYHEHVEPAYQDFIAPYREEMDLIVDNTISITKGKERLESVIANWLKDHA